MHAPYSLTFPKNGVPVRSCKQSGFIKIEHQNKKYVIHTIFAVNNTLIERVNNFNYLGLQFTNDLNWEKHKCVISLKLTKTIGVLNRLRYE